VKLAAPPKEVASDAVRRFKPALNEVILIPIPTKEDRKPNENPLAESEKKKFDVKSIVGKRVSVYWPSMKDWFSGTVIGYSSNMASNLIFYDELRTPDTPDDEDFYKVSLFPAKGRVRLDKWRLLA
jgi:hypothetical protein